MEAMPESFGERIATLDNRWYVDPLFERGGNALPAERLSMRKIKEVLRLKFGLRFANRHIARICSINHSTVADYLNRAEAAGLGQWPLPDDLDDTSLENRLFPVVVPRPEQPRATPNWPVIHEELQTDKHVTLQLVWQE